MDILEQALRPVDVYKLNDPTGFSDATWEYVATVQMYVEPVVGFQRPQNQQDFQGVSSNGFMPIAFRGVVHAGYGIVEEDGTQHVNKGEPERWDNLIPYVMCKLDFEQFPITTRVL